MAATAAAVGQPPVWREPQKGDTWRWLLVHLGIRDFFIFSAMRNEAGGLLDCCVCGAAMRVACCAVRFGAAAAEAAFNLRT